MGNVGFVDIEELKKVREELNKERGIETDPNMYNNYNPNREKEETASADETAEQSSSFAEETENSSFEPDENNYNNITNSDKENSYNNKTSLETEENDINAENLTEEDDFEQEEENAEFEFNEKSENGLDLSKFKINENEYNNSFEDDFEKSSKESLIANEGNVNDNQTQVKTEEEEEDFDVNEFFNELMSEDENNLAENVEDENQEADTEENLDLNNEEEKSIIEEENAQTFENEHSDFDNNNQQISEDFVKEEKSVNADIEEEEVKDFDVYDNFAEFEIKGYENNIPEEEKQHSLKEQDTKESSQEENKELADEEAQQEEEKISEEEELLNFFDNEEESADNEQAESEILEENPQETSIENEEPNEEINEDNSQELADENSNNIEEIAAKNIEADAQNKTQENEQFEEIVTENVEEPLNEKLEEISDDNEETGLSGEIEQEGEGLENFDIGATLAAFDKEQQEIIDSDDENELNSEESEEETEEEEELEVNSALNIANETKPYEKIKPYKFVEILQTEEFKSSEKLSYLFGKDEQDRLMFMNLRDMFNTAIFGLNEKSIFSYISSMLLSLALKNSVNDVNFVICDSKLTSDYEVFDKSSYMFFNRVAKTNREILDTLAELENELENRYLMLAEVGTKSIEHYNKFASEADISPMPYIIVVFNNYSRSSGMILGEQINICLSNLLRLGRLVGIYFVVSAYETIENSFVNLNLSGRMAHQTHSEENSIFEVGTTDATRLEQDDEFVYTSVNGDEIFHLKTAKLTLNEVNLIIENLEK